MITLDVQGSNYGPTHLSFGILQFIEHVMVWYERDNRIIWSNDTLAMI